MCDQNDISLETAAQIVIAGLQSGLNLGHLVGSTLGAQAEAG